MTSRKRCPNDFIFKEELGHGSYSTVYKAYDKRNDKKIYAIKICSKAHIIREAKVKYVTIEKNTLNSLARANHPGIVKLYYTFHDKDNLYFVLDFAPGGELLSLLHKMGKFNEIWSKHFTVQLIDTLFYIHSQGIIHRDLKPENVLLDKDGRLMITDFGAASTVDSVNNNNKPTTTENEDDNNNTTSSFVGTAEYVSPELLLYNQSGFCSDIWALGCMIYQFLEGHPPFRGENELRTFEKIVALDYTWNQMKALSIHVNHQIVNLVRKILVVDPKDRITLNEIRFDPWFNNIDWNDKPSIWRGIWQIQQQNQEKPQFMAMGNNHLMPNRQLHVIDTPVKNITITKQKRKKPTKVSNTTSSIVEWRRKLGITAGGDPNENNSNKSIPNGSIPTLVPTSTTLPPMPLVQTIPTVNIRSKNNSTISNIIPKIHSNHSRAHSGNNLNAQFVQSGASQYGIGRPQQALNLKSNDSSQPLASVYSSTQSQLKPPMKDYPPVTVPIQQVSSSQQQPLLHLNQLPEQRQQSNQTVPTNTTGVPRFHSNPKNVSSASSLTPTEAPISSSESGTAGIGTLQHTPETDDDILKQDYVYVKAIPYKVNGPEMSLTSYNKINNNLITSLVSKEKDALRGVDSQLKLLTLKKTGNLSYSNTSNDETFPVVNIGDSNLSMYDFEFDELVRKGFLILEKYKHLIWFISLPPSSVTFTNPGRSSIINTGENWVNCFFRARQLMEEKEITDKIEKVSLEDQDLLASKPIPSTPTTDYTPPSSADTVTNRKLPNISMTPPFRKTSDPNSTPQVAVNLTAHRDSQYSIHPQMHGKLSQEKGTTTETARRSVSSPINNSPKQKQRNIFARSSSIPKPKSSVPNIPQNSKKYAAPRNMVISSSRYEVIHSLSRHGNSDYTAASSGASAAFKNLQKRNNK